MNERFEEDSSSRAAKKYKNWFESSQFEKVSDKMNLNPDEEEIRSSESARLAGSGTSFFVISEEKLSNEELSVHK